MGCLFILNDSQTNIFWKKSIFKIEKFIIIESIISIILTFIALLTFPFESIKLVRQKILIESLVYYIFSFSLLSLFFSILINYIHTQKKRKPNYRLCLMNFCGHSGLFSFVICFILSLYITLVIMEWEDINGILSNRRLSTKKKATISFGKVIFTLIWNDFILICNFFGIADFLMEISIITRASKFLSEGNNINNQNLLYELFKIPIIKKFHNNIGNGNILNNSDIKNIDKNQKYSKFRITMSNNKNCNNFENENNKFREIEIIQKIEYNSISTQTEDINNSFINNYINENNDKLIDEDLSNNFILIKNKPLIDSKTSLNEILNSPVK